MNLKRLLVPLLGIFLALLTLLPVEATESRDLFEVEDVPNVQIGDSLRFVSDPSHFLDSSEVEELDNKLHQLRLNFGVDAALVVLPSIGDRTIEDFSVELFRSWGLGNKKTNSGLLILLIMDVHKIFITTGYGIEGVLPDATCSSIIRNRMIPHFKEDAYAEGLMSGIDAISEIFKTGDFEGSDGGNSSEEEEGDYILFIFYLLFVLYYAVNAYAKLTNIFEKKGEYKYKSAPERLARLKSKNKTYSVIFAIACLPIGIVIYLLGKNLCKKLDKESKRCPNCGKEAMLPISDRAKVRALLNPQMLLETDIKSREYGAMQCSSCGYEHVFPVRELPSRYSRCPKCGTYAYYVVRREETTNHYITDYKCLYCNHEDRKKRPKESPVRGVATAAAAGSILGGLSGRGSSGSSWGGSSGGGWGGGSTGGGGAGGSW